MEQTILLSQALWFWGILFLLGIMPGMGMVNVIYFTATRGLLSGVIASLGTLGADLFYILLATLGSSLTMIFFLNMERKFDLQVVLSFWFFP